jgi:hypothetical protein
MKNPIFKFEQEPKQRVNAYASDYGKLEADIILEYRGVEMTNPPEYTDSLKWNAGKGVEEGMIEVLKANGCLNDYHQDNQASMKLNYKDIVISMKPDCKAQESIFKVAGEGLDPLTIELHEGEPIEIKSLNNKNSVDVKKYEEGNPRENYVGQLATYMYTMKKKRGHLFLSTIDGLHTFWFICEEVGEGKYKCENTEVDLFKELDRYVTVYKRHLAGEEPNWFEETYKMPLESIDWKSLKQTAIGDARNNKKVVGSENSYKINYSNYKDLIIQKQGATLGYNEGELTIIKEATTGYTTWFKKTKNEDINSTSNGDN